MAWLGAFCGVRHKRGGGGKRGTNHLLRPCEHGCGPWNQAERWLESVLVRRERSEKDGDWQECCQPATE